MLVLVGILGMVVGVWVGMVAMVVEVVVLVVVVVMPEERVFHCRVRGSPGLFLYLMMIRCNNEGQEWP